MTDSPTPKSASQTLAEAVARRKALAEAKTPFHGARQSERAAAASSASKSKPSGRK